MNDTILQTREKISKELNLENNMAAPQIKKIVVNVGFGQLASDQKERESILDGLKKITGQKPKTTKAKRAISSFKIRQDQVIGAKVTLRGKKMHDFYKRLVNIVLPRVRDFRGVSSGSFDDQGNYTLGFREINVFPEIDYKKGEKQFGLEITINTSAKKNKDANKLLEIMGMPFKKESSK